MVTHRDLLKRNARIGRIDATWDRMTPARQREYLDSAAAVLKSLEPAKPGYARDV